MAIRIMNIEKDEKNIKRLQEIAGRLTGLADEQNLLLRHCDSIVHECIDIIYEYAPDGDIRIIAEAGRRSCELMASSCDKVCALADAVFKLAHVLNDGFDIT